MNKGKPSGFRADTKDDAGAKSTSRPRDGQAGVGAEYTDRQANAADQSTASAIQILQRRDEANDPVNPFPDIRNGASTNGKSRVVRFEFNDGHAQKVSIAGSFNDWRPEASEMLRLEDGKWWKDLSLSPGEYEYRFVIDGKWVTDPECPQERANGFGENNSVLLVPES
jgi:1,4-alpha-glucan branching enzyme